MHRCGIIDLGSNTIRLVVYEVKKDLGERITKKDFSTLISTKKTAGLSSYVIDGRFTDIGVERAISILADMIRRAKTVNCKDVHIFATAVLRNCDNSKEVVRAIEKGVGQSIDLISGDEEARLDFIGASCDRDIRSGTLIDIGGGSTELVHALDGNAVDVISLPIGSVSTYSTHVSQILPTAKEIKAIAKAAHSCLSAVDKIADYRSKTLYGVGGSIRALGKLHAMLEGEEKQSRELSLADIERMYDEVKNSSSEFAHAIVKAAPDRIHTIGCGITILHQAMEELGAKKILICKYGVREGYLLECVRAS